ncbi:MAG: ribosomal protein S18-alanine N-acetyltransferase [Erysipelotrichaceae bacterium]|nr:ribosomal protein S18-alanine N-acetyltransferase [Erysipelotrichaceae bacterium]
MSLEDLDQVLEIENKSFSRPWSRQYFEQELNNKELCQLFVYREDDRIIAYGDLWYMFENCDLTKIAVREEYRNRGYGYKMMSYLIRTAKARECEFMHLEVDVNNEAAIGLYRKMNFEIVRTRKKYYENGNDAYDMLRGLIEIEPRKILAIETSCDETACAIIDENLNVYSSLVTSQVEVHARFGGVIPEVAARRHVELISTIVNCAIDE